ncbi:DUF6274 family protein [Streptomyces paludis]
MTVSTTDPSAGQTGPVSRERPQRPLRHETGALLRAHLAAASGHPHRTGHCPICYRLQRLAMESAAGDDPFNGELFTTELFKKNAADRLSDGQYPSAG